MVKENKELVSIIIPFYNCKHYITPLIESLLKQTFVYWQAYIVNDGSTDGSEIPLAEYAAKDSRITVIHKYNTGLSDTRNTGLDLSKGKYICFIDADDFIEPDFLESAIHIFEKYQVDLVNTGFFSEVSIADKKGQIQVYRDKITIGEKLYKNKGEIQKDFVYMWDKHMLYNVWNKLYLREIIEKNNIRFPSYNWGEDIAFNRLYLRYTDKVYHLEKCYYHYIRERAGALTYVYKKDLFDIRKKEFKEFNAYFEEYGIPKSSYMEFSHRRYVERTLECIQNVFHVNQKTSLKEKYKETKTIIEDPITRDALAYAKPTSKKIKILLIPYRLHLIWLAMFMGKLLYIIKVKYPNKFNQLKNKR